MKKKELLILSDIRDDVVWVTIKRPGDRNSINTPLIREIETMLAEMENTSKRAVVFSGAGDSFFIGGADAVEMIQYSPDEAYAFSDRIQELFNRMEASPLVLVAAINGLCYGGGCEFALACDFRIIAKSARIGLPEVRVGIIPGGGGTQRLPKIIGKGKAMEVILKGRLYSSDEALNMGMVHDVVPDGEIQSAVSSYLQPIFKNPQHALSNAKRAVQSSQNFGDGPTIEKERFKECFKEDFFVNEISNQLKSGQMESKEIPDWVF